MFTNSDSVCKKYKIDIKYKITLHDVKYIRKKKRNLLLLLPLLCEDEPKM